MVVGFLQKYIQRLENQHLRLSSQYFMLEENFEVEAIKFHEVFMGLERQL